MMLTYTVTARPVRDRDEVELRIKPPRWHASTVRVDGEDWAFCPASVVRTAIVRHFDVEHSQIASVESDPHTSWPNLRFEVKATF